MQKTVMSIKTDMRLKKQAQQVARDLGFRLGTLINAFLRQIVREKSIAFHSKPDRPSAWLKKELSAIEKDICSGKNISPEFDNLESAIHFLRSA